MTAHPDPGTPTGGLSLVEILVSMTILSVASLSMGSLLFQAARQAGATCITVDDPAFPHEKCVTIVNVNSKAKNVTATITPIREWAAAARLTTVRRTISGNATR